MVFRDYIKSLPNQREETIKKIAQITFTDVSTVYKWINGSVEPPILKKNIVANLLNKTVEELWP